MIAEAFDQAEKASSAAEVEIRELVDLSDLLAVRQLFDEIWQPEPSQPAITVELLRALAQAGNYVAGAFHGEVLVGACVGFFGPPAAATLHSHIAGVRTSTAGRHVGLALKLHQRAWALALGVTGITWTFDPLVSRNAYFNLVKLGAVPTAYRPDFYGPMHDARNTDDATDRLLVRWDLAAPEVVAACAGRPRPGDVAAARADAAVVRLGRSPDGRPLVPSELVDGPVLLVAAPTDIEALRGSDPAGATAWRRAQRAALAPLLDGGATVTGFDRSGWYLLRAAATPA